MTYQEQIKHPKWQKKRLEVLQANKFRCQDCGNNEEELHVHHPFYRKGAKIWEYEVAELESLCHKCHKEKHTTLEMIGKALASCKNLPLVLAYIQGLNDAHIPPTKTTSETVKPKKRSRFAPRVVEDATPLQQENTPASSDAEDEAFYKEYPQYRPSKDDDSRTKADKFWARMKIMMG